MMSYDIDRVLAAFAAKTLFAAKAIGGEYAIVLKDSEIEAFEKSGRWVFVERVEPDAYRFALDTRENIEKRMRAEKAKYGKRT